MNDRLYSTTYSDENQVEQSPFSGNWNYVASYQQFMKGGRGMNVLRASGLSIIIALSPIATGSDPWWNDRKNYVNHSIGAVFNPIVRRRISLLEARKLALNILYQAEIGRINAAEYEARGSMEIGL